MNNSSPVHFLIIPSPAKCRKVGRAAYDQLAETPRSNGIGTHEHNVEQKDQKVRRYENQNHPIFPIFCELKMRR